MRRGRIRHGGRGERYGIRERWRLGWENSCGLRWVSGIVFSMVEKNAGYLVRIGRERLNGNVVFISIEADKSIKGRDREAEKETYR